MNLQPQFKKISILPPLIAPALVALTALIVVPALLGDGTPASGGASGCNSVRIFWSDVPFAEIRAANECGSRRSYGAWSAGWDSGCE